MKKKCRICHNSKDLTTYTVREMMFGTKDTFDYFQCPECDCLQIADTPVNLGDYYPSSYYSYRGKHRFEKAKLRRWIDTCRVASLLEKNNIIGHFVEKIAKPLDYIPWVKMAGIDGDSRILDVGCGQGRLLLRMSLGGFKYLTGIDPFVTDDIRYNSGVTVLKQDLAELSSSGRRFDFIMLHHSFEHMPDPATSLKIVGQLLDPGGVVLLRIPLVDSFAWDQYKVDWVQLDAPRHLYLHSRRSVENLAKTSGLYIDKIDYDSSRFQFVGSELYKRDIPLSSDKQTRDIFSREELQEFTRKAEQLNLIGRGDQAVFYLRKNDS